MFECRSINNLQKPKRGSCCPQTWTVYKGPLGVANPAVPATCLFVNLSDRTFRFWFEFPEKSFPQELADVSRAVLRQNSLRPEFLKALLAKRDWSSAIWLHPLPLQSRKTEFASSKPERKDAVDPAAIAYFRRIVARGVCQIAAVITGGRRAWCGRGRR
jgi:hypothetical protein